ncbi:MAG: helix-turn-helix domain-containing protein [Pseudomonadota bacterium]
MTPLGVRLRSLRKQRGVTQLEMAQALGVSNAYLSALEHGHRGLPNWGFIQRLVGYFNLIWDEAEQLEALAMVSDPKVVIDTAGGSPEATRLANRLSRLIGALSADQCAALEDHLVRLAGEGGPGRPAGDVRE